MKYLSILVFIVLSLISCKGDEEKEENLEQESSIDKVDKEKKDDPNLQPLTNMYGDDSVDASGNFVYDQVDDFEDNSNRELMNEEGLGYKLGIRPEHPLVNKYGGDSIGPDGDFVYPPRDTIWNEE